LEQSQFFADVDLIGIVAVAGVQHFGGGADGIGEGGALVERWCDGRPVGAGFRVAVNGAGGKAQTTAFHAAVKRMEPPGFRSASRRCTSSSSIAGAGPLAPRP